MNKSISYFGKIFIFNLLTVNWKLLEEIKFWAKRIGYMRESIDKILVQKFQK